ncbi:MAG: mercuric transport protein MerTP [Vicingus serpentipes]|nr:mercuric transport protein MerTP [Vicingus serpentipes]
MKSNNKELLGIGVLSAIGASLCCITPLLALISGTSGLASAFLWLEPFRPYLIGTTVLVLGFAWYQKLRPKKEMGCNCDEEEKTKFIQSKAFLSIVTVFAILMLCFPYYEEVFYPTTKNKKEMMNKENMKTITLEIEGMTCASCENHVTHALNELEGISKATVSYEQANAVVEFDPSKTTIKKIEKAVNNTGYKVHH